MDVYFFKQLINTHMRMGVFISFASRKIREKCFLRDSMQFFCGESEYVQIIQIKSRIRGQNKKYFRNQQFEKSMFFTRNLMLRFGKILVLLSMFHSARVFIIKENSLLLTHFRPQDYPLIFQCFLLCMHVFIFNSIFYLISFF